MITLDTICIRTIVEKALSEDIGSGDITTQLTVPIESGARAEITAKESGILAGQDIAECVFAKLDHQVRYQAVQSDCAPVSKGEVIAVVSGSARSILTGERVALNFLQRLSGIATATAEYVKAVKGTNAQIVDTRKTTPGLRALEKYAVHIGGGRNHRFGLADGILIKDNHITAAGGVGNALRNAKNGAPHTLKIEIEVTDLEMLELAISAGADIVMLDNMDIESMRRAVEINNGRVLLEASGGVNLQTVREIAETGVDIISIGALTHSVRALDMSLNIV